ncbi:iron-sulfur cluster assembly accessory protein [Limnoraphis robusta]|uniref:Iron-sulfur cluster assembly accessory protein n=1 Tax=Limnoraphis robusta CCNP1315 TaxID=3110306 RepID=A0ABU5TZH4_9CYAN|nr:iron-sulfur cluster assembly accessory protein [Limnoraphis robusta]MEA5520336.1 iron-sulfur cluster assembly accessory protein [Limnoraphis robusta CCNP1315]MEA5548333.1 iron-sulfur cluster assembly accessory protein [Limnoraphis robusta CCNP1324]
MIQVTPSATREVLRLKSKQKDPSVLFRLGVESGGCCGLFYRMRFEPALQPDDIVYNCGAIQVVIDAQSLSHVEGLILDYSEDLMGGGFRFNNPNAAKTCGCSHSFVARA